VGARAIESSEQRAPELAVIPSLGHEEKPGALATSPKAVFDDPAADERQAIQVAPRRSAAWAAVEQSGAVSTRHPSAHYFDTTSCLLWRR
jgi:hypothetical protein